MNHPNDPTQPAFAPKPEPAPPGAPAPDPAPAGLAETGPETAAPAPAAPTEPGIAEIQQYVWSRYVEFKEAPFELDEAQALRTLEEHYRTHSLTTDSECFYYGILAYELAFSQPDPTPLLRKALAAFLAYRGQISSDFSFDAVDDRYADALETLGLGGGKGPSA